MEIAGAALGTLIARSSEFAVTFLYIFLIDQKLQLRPGHLLKSPSSRFYGNFFRLGAPVLLSDFLLGFGSNMISVVLGHMGAVVVASNAVCQVVDRLATVVTQGIGNAAAVITGQTVGAKEYDKAMEQGETFYFLSVVVGCFAAFCVYFLGPLTFKVYNLEPETLVMARQIMGAYAVIALFGAIQSVMTKGVLRGGGDTKFLMKADILFLWIVSVPLGALVGLVLHGPAWLTVICLRIDYIIKSIWCIGRLLSGKWIHRFE